MRNGGSKHARNELEALRDHAGLPEQRQIRVGRSRARMVQRSSGCFRRKD
jgi:hypothetical protein